MKNFLKKIGIKFSNIIKANIIILAFLSISLLESNRIRMEAKNHQGSHIYLSLIDNKDKMPANDLNAKKYEIEILNKTNNDITEQKFGIQNGLIRSTVISKHNIKFYKFFYSYIKHNVLSPLYNTVSIFFKSKNISQFLEHTAQISYEDINFLGSMYKDDIEKALKDILLLAKQNNAKKIFIDNIMISEYDSYTTITIISKAY